MISLLGILLALVIVGFVLWLVQYLPLQATIKQIIIGVVIFCVVIYVIEAVLGGPAIFSLR
jgi:hypothetical protein